LRRKLSGLIELLAQNLPRGDEENDERKTVRIVGVPAEIRTEYFINTSLKRYC
jgi:hypothetical protein